MRFFRRLFCMDSSRANVCFKLICKRLNFDCPPPLIPLFIELYEFAEYLHKERMFDVLYEFDDEQDSTFLQHWMICVNTTYRHVPIESILNSSYFEQLMKEKRRHVKQSMRSFFFHIRQVWIACETYLQTHPGEFTMSKHIYSVIYSIYIDSSYIE